MNPKEVHQDAALTSFSVAYKPSGFIADLVAPISSVTKESDKYYVWSQADTFRTFDDLRAAGAEAAEVDFGFSKDTYYAEEYALKVSIPFRSIENADDGLRLEQSKTRFLKNALLNGREKRVATLFTTAANYASGLSTTYSGTSQWDNAGYTGDPLKELDNAAELVRQKSGVRPNTLIVGGAVAPVLKNNANFRDHYKYVKGDVETAGLPSVISGMKVLVPGAAATTSNPGATTTAIADVWGKNVILAYVDPTDDLETLTFAKTFRKSGDQVRKWDDLPKKAAVVENMLAIEDTKVVANSCGYLIKAVIA